MLVVADINTIWRRRPFQALSELRPVLGLEPMDPLVALRQRRIPWGTAQGGRGKMKSLSVVLPFGWATRKVETSLPQLWAAVVRRCRAGGSGAEPSALVVTSPHYAPLVEQLAVRCPTFYYCSDNYAGYAGWDADEMRRQEAVIFQHVRHAFFVSSALRERALREYAMDGDRSSVSMNATDEEFLSPVPAAEFEALSWKYPRLKHPVAGVIGGLNDRLDYSLLLKVAEIESLGTLLLVGPHDSSQHSSELSTLLRHPRVLVVGKQPHASLPTWQQALDVALIPYRESEFNHFCSPMRLFDHLAAGRPVIATTACPQVDEFTDFIRTVNASSFERAVAGELNKATSSSSCERMRTLSRRHTWRARATAINAVISTEMESCPASLRQA